MKAGVFIISVLIVILVAGGVYFFWQDGSNSQTPNQDTGTIDNSNQVFTEEQTLGEIATGNPVSHDVEISGFSFSPSTLTISVGDSVIWTNMDSATHTITSDSGNELDSETFSNGNSYSHTFTTAGTYAYHCNIHTSMKGTIVVE